jgi:hypothetical protein
MYANGLIMLTKKNFPIVLFYTFFCATAFELKAQLSYKVLFLGNSYTAVNNLPQLVHDVALSAGDTLVFDYNAPGGYQLINHSIDLTTQGMIMAGDWNYVVLQGQSQEPIISYSDFINGAYSLYNLIKQYNPCAETMPYMTWGRKNGDASNCAGFPVMCTYEGMDSTLRDRYLYLTSSVNGEVSPVSVVWNYLRQYYPAIELYQADESHPSLAGSYAAACCFYTSIFKKDPASITFNSGLSAADASIIKDAVKAMVYDSLQSWDFKKLPVSDFRYQTGPGVNEVICNPVNVGIRQTYFWSFGDGDTSGSASPTHSYLTDGTFTLSLTTTNCDLQGLHTSFTDTVIQFCSHTPTVYTMHPWLCNEDTLWTDAADSYQWFLYGVPIPETNQYLPDYSRYGISGFSVSAELNGCTELSQLFTETAEWSGYYFDLIGDPCLGDTVAFAVLHINGLSGSENIRWYINDTLMTSMNDEDTLLITVQGKYDCKVINPTSSCPLDTTSYSIEYDCGLISVDEIKNNLSWTIFPNPVTESIFVEFAGQPVHETIQIYNATGYLLMSIPTSTQKMKINIAGFPQGLFYLRMKSMPSAIKFIKL